MCCSPTPAKYPTTNTHGTGTCMRSRENVDSLITVVAEVWLMLRESIALASSHFATQFAFWEDERAQLTIIPGPAAGRRTHMKRPSSTRKGRPRKFLGPPSP
jgi:hypothetical protein